MPILNTLLGPISSILDKVIPDKAARERAKLELITLEGTQEMRMIEAQLQAIVAEANSQDPWTSRARPSFLYVMYAMILFSLPMGVLSAFRPTWRVKLARASIIISMAFPKRSMRCSARVTSATPPRASGARLRAWIARATPSPFAMRALSLRA